MQIPGNREENCDEFMRNGVRGRIEACAPDTYEVTTMSTFNLSMIAFAAALLTGCALGDAKDDSPTTPPSTASAATPAPEPTAIAAAETPAPRPAKQRTSVETVGPHIDASAFLNALVDSGCQIDKAEYKEVKRGGAIKVVCSRTVDPLSVDLDDL